MNTHSEDRSAPTRRRQLITAMALTLLVAGALPPLFAQNADRNSPVSNARVLIEIEGVQGLDRVTLAQPLSMSTEVIEYQDGDDLLLRKRPGKSRFGDIVITGGYPFPRDLLAWYRNTQRGQNDRKAVAVILTAGPNREFERWTAANTWPRSIVFDPARNRWEVTLAAESITMGDEPAIDPRTGGTRPPSRNRDDGRATKGSGDTRTDTGSGQYVITLRNGTKLNAKAVSTMANNPALYLIQRTDGKKIAIRKSDVTSIRRGAVKQPPSKNSAAPVDPRAGKLAPKPVK